MHSGGDEMGGLLQDCRPGALLEQIERRDRRGDEAVAPLPRRLNAKRSDQRCLVTAGVLAGALAKRQLIGLDVENIIGDLKGRAKRLAVAREGGACRGRGLPENRAGMTA